MNYAQAQPVNDRKDRVDRLVHAFHPRFTWRSASGDWETALDVANLTDEVYYQNIMDGVSRRSAIRPPRSGRRRCGRWTSAELRAVAGLVSSLNEEARAVVPLF